MRALVMLVVLATPALAAGSPMAGEADHPVPVATGGGDDAGPDGGSADAGASPDAGPAVPDAGRDDADIGLPAPADHDGCSSTGEAAGLAPLLIALGLLAVRRRGL